MRKQKVEKKKMRKQQLEKKKVRMKNMKMKINMNMMMKQ